MSVIVYSKNNCAACERAKALLKQKGVDFEVKNIDSDMEAMDFIVSKGHRSVPQVYVNGVHTPPEAIVDQDFIE